jgi:hypothetical protein
VKFLETIASVELNDAEREIVVAFFFGHVRLDPSDQLQMRAELDKLDPMMIGWAGMPSNRRDSLRPVLGSRAMNAPAKLANGQRVA